MMNLEEIRERVEYAPRLLVSKANEGGYEHPASVFEEEDGLDALCFAHPAYGPEWQDAGMQSIVDAFEDRARLLAALDYALTYGNAYTRAELLEMVDEKLEDWKPREY